MGLIQDYIRRMKERKAMRENYEREQYTVDSYHTKQLSANERELMRYREEEREKRIKVMLEHKRKQENDKVWRGREGNPAYAKNVTAGHKKLFTGGNMFAHVQDVVNQSDVVVQPNIFKRKDKFFKGGI